MKIIKLLNKIANGEELPEKIKYNDKIWRLASNRTYFIGSDYGYDFWLEHGDDKFEDEPITLNDEVEILEEEKKIPEKEKIYKIEDDLPYESLIVWQRANNKIFEKQINEIIDYLDYLKSKGE